MQSAGAEDETKFIVDQVSAIVEEAIEVSLGDSEYVNMKVNTWINSILEITLTSLAKLQKAFKYIVTCVILQVIFHVGCFSLLKLRGIITFQKMGAGLILASSSYWDRSLDGSCTVRWENETTCVIVNVYGLSME